MSKSIVVSLAILFGLTVLAGVLTPNEADNVENILLSYLEEEGVEDSMPQFSDATTTNVDASFQTTPTELEGDNAVDVNLKILYSVVRVIDGDTIVINKDGVNESVRMIGIDTPETVHPSKPVQCFGIEASRKTKEWLEGRSVELIVDKGQGERDKYQRLLGYVYRDDGMFINLELIKQGYAYEYTYKEPYKYQEEFKAAEAEASGAKRGLWADGICE